jgi:hypothetical protein
LLCKAIRLQEASPKQSRWVHQILQCIRRYKSELADDEREDDSNGDAFTYKDDAVTRWLITSFVTWGNHTLASLSSGCKHYKCPSTKAKWMWSITAMWSDAGVGVVGQVIIMKYFIEIFGYKFTVAESSLITQLAVDSVPLVAGTVAYSSLEYCSWTRLLTIATGTIIW